MTHDAKVETAKQSINEVFADTSVGRAQTRDSLEKLLTEIHSMLDTLDDDEE